MEMWTIRNWTMKNVNGRLELMHDGIGYQVWAEDGMAIHPMLDYVDVPRDVKRRAERTAIRHYA